MEPIAVVALGALAGLLGALAFSLVRPTPPPLPSVGPGGRPVHVSTLAKSRPIEGKVPRPGFVPFLEVTLEPGKWLVLGDVGVVLETWGSGPFFDWEQDGGLGCQIWVGNERAKGRFQSIQFWDDATSAFATRGTLSLHMVVDLPSGGAAYFGWEMLPTQQMWGIVETGSSLTAVPIDDIRRHPEALNTEDYLAGLANQSGGGFQMPPTS